MRCLASVSVLIFVVSSAHGASYTINRNGINSKVTGLDGTGERIGQAESGRPGKFDKDAVADAANNTFPTQVYVQSLNSGGVDGASSPNITDHATGVAGVMIGKAAPFAIHEGVAPEAQLHAVAILGTNQVTGALALDRIADLNGAPVRAINMSFGVPLSFPEDVNGNSHITQYVDWSADQHNVVYVSAWPNNDISEPFALSDNFNGITVAASEQPSEQNFTYSKFSSTNSTDFFTLDAIGPRTSIDILAPGYMKYGY